MGRGEEVSRWGLIYTSEQYEKCWGPEHPAQSHHEVSGGGSGGAHEEWFLARWFLGQRMVSSPQGSQEEGINLLISL